MKRDRRRREEQIEKKEKKGKGLRPKEENETKTVGKKVNSTIAQKIKKMG